MIKFAQCILTERLFTELKFHCFGFFSVSKVSDFNIVNNAKHV